MLCGFSKLLNAKNVSLFISAGWNIRNTKKLAGEYCSRIKQQRWVYFWTNVSKTTSPQAELFQIQAADLSLELLDSTTLQYTMELTGLFCYFCGHCPDLKRFQIIFWDRLIIFEVIWFNWNASEMVLRCINWALARNKSQYFAVASWTNLFVCLIFCREKNWVANGKKMESRDEERGWNKVKNLIYKY